MEQIWNNLSKKQKIGLLAGGIILILLTVLATVAIINRDEPIARIKNLDNYLVGATASDKDHLQKELYNFLTRQYTNTEITNLSLPIPTKIGYTFDGWYTQETGGTKIITPTPALLSDKTIYAHWIANTP